MNAILVLLVVVLGLVALFAVQNPGIITVNFLSVSGRTSLLAVIVTSFALGVAAAFLGGIPSWMRRRRRIRELEAEIASRKQAPAPPPPVTP